MTRDPIHPGKFLADELEALNMTPTQLAAALKVPPNRIYQLLAGKRALTADTALRLSHWLGTSAELWLNLQKLYELRLAERETAGEKIRRRSAGCPDRRNQACSVVTTLCLGMPSENRRRSVLPRFACPWGYTPFDL